MDYSTMIDKIMPLVNSGDSSLPFIISRNEGEWEIDYLTISPDNEKIYLDSVREYDPCAAQYTGVDFSRGSFSYVHDKVLANRIIEEYYFDANSGKNSKELNILAGFVADNIGEFPAIAIDYVTKLDKPLAALHRMDITVPIGGDGAYDESRTEEVIGKIENKINELRSRKNEEFRRDMPEKRVIEGYTEKYCIEFAGKEIVIGENLSAKQPYFICNISYDNFLGMEERYDGVVSFDYVEIMRELTKRIDTLSEQLEAARRESGLPVQVMTVKDCLPNSQNVDWTGKTVIVKPEILSPEYRSAESQYVLCTGGFGARPNSRGSKVYVKELFSGKECYYRSHQIAGIADPSKMPEWALNKLSELSGPEEQRAKEPPVKQFHSKKSSLHDKLEKAKITAQDTARNRDNGGAIPKKRDDMEV